MLNLPQVTLCCVDTRLPDLALGAIRKCMADIQFGNVLLFTRSEHGLIDVPREIKIIELDVIRSVEDYSRFMLKGLGPYLNTSHMLIVQWDGYVMDSAMWRDDFLSVDYIGAVWPQYKDTQRVGNGGFSLRSRKLLDALSSADIIPSHPEDVCIARTYRLQLEQRWGIRFADEALAHQFAFERERSTPSSFGFHGLSNLPEVLPQASLIEFVKQAPPELFASVEARRFIKRLITRGFKDAAHTALSKRAQYKPSNLADLRLWLRYYLG